MKIIVGMSGGVDSSVAAYLLKEQGHEVIGVFMKNWEDASDEPEYRKDTLSGCSWEEDYDDVRAVCDQLGIPYRTYNFVEEYRKAVFEDFVRELEAGRTPNPDILCNQEVKFKAFLEKALKEPGIDAIATGHYAAIVEGKLARPKDHNKDQTYFLYRIDRERLANIVFPLQNLTKDEVRAIAQEQGFPNADKKDSTGICFIGDIDYDAFIDQYIEKKPGKIVTKEGEVIGDHEGLHFFTIGQRKGINIGGTGPYFVLEKRMDTGQLVVTNDTDDPDLYSSQCLVTDMHWLQDLELPFECTTQIRYRQPEQQARVEEAENGVRVVFAEPQRAITIGQSAVFYKNDTVIGGGIIDAVV